jgi:hypothetical protein
LTDPRERRTVAGIVTDDVPPAEPLPLSLRWFALWRWKRRWQILVPVLVLGYPLSFGPLVWLHDRQRLPQFASRVLKGLYAPLEMICERSEWWGSAVRYYVELWESLP